VSDEAWWQLLLLAAGAHVGLQLVVHLVVYPALADAGAGGPASARAGHERHVRRMSVAVAPVYGLLVVGAAAVVLADPSVLSAAAAAVVLGTLAVTGLLAVPAHEGIAGTDDPAVRAGLHRRLARADLARLLLAVALVPLAWLGTG
jgi:hypothetical protein